MKFTFKQLVYAFTVFALILLQCRMFRSDSLSYIFLVWNLFLAFIPWWISNYIKQRKELSLKHAPLLVMWLLFLPNAPYILTDLFHLKPRPYLPLWFDLVLVLSFALIGMILFLKSLKDMLALLKGYLSPTGFAIITPVIFWLISFGLYLGRYLRFNSWDIVHPVSLMKSCLRLFIHEQSLKEVGAFTLVFSAFLMMLFYIVHHQSTEERGISKQ